MSRRSRRLLQKDSIDVANNDDDVGKDAAVFRLDTRVLPGVADPLRPAGVDGTPRCNDDFDDGLVIGFGQRSLRGAEGVFDERNWNTSNDWGRVGLSGGQLFENSFAFGIGYAGTLKGDSGGPLLDGSRDKVCGINSAFVDVGVSARTKHAAVDSDEMIGWLTQIITDKRGNWIGELPGFDGDGDGVADVEDNCPNVPNADQSDVDWDGVGDRCDNCMNDANPPSSGNLNFDPAADPPPQDNANFFAEVQANGGLPNDLRRPTSTDPDSYLTQKFPGDVCDPAPLTVTTPGTGAYNPTNTPRTVSCQFIPGVNCSGPPPGDVCGVSRNNRITASSWVGSGLPQSQNGLTRVLTCLCAEGHNRTEREQVDGCSRGNVTSFSGAWRNVTLGVPTQASDTALLTLLPTADVLTLHPRIGDATGQTTSSAEWG